MAKTVDAEPVRADRYGAPEPDARTYIVLTRGTSARVGSNPTASANKKYMNERKELLKKQIVKLYQENPKTGLVQFLITLERDIKGCQPAEIAETLRELIAVK
jgi:hypothetical protein